MGIRHTVCRLSLRTRAAGLAQLPFPLVVLLGILLLHECSRAADQPAPPANASQADDHADDHPTTIAGHDLPPADPHHADQPDTAADDPAANGLKLGEFRIRGYYPVESQKCEVTFTLYASVPEEKRPQSRQRFVHRRHKVRDRVILAARLVPLAQFDEPDLASFRRRIVVLLRRSVPELSIDNVYVSDFHMQLERI